MQGEGRISGTYLWRDLKSECVFMKVMLVAHHHDGVTLKRDRSRPEAPRSYRPVGEPANLRVFRFVTIVEAITVWNPLFT